MKGRDGREETYEQVDYYSKSYVLNQICSIWISKTSMQQ